MSFKDTVKADLKTTFFNLDEFSEEHQVDKKKMNIIIDSNEEIERGKRSTQVGEGLFLKQVLFYVSEEEFGDLPKIGRQMTLDGQDYIVTDAIDEDGVFFISLEALQS